ncbi:MAG: RdgB/HAM1 family non-canonical purine NTP pyrophosphatase [Prevotella sp.]|nr:RdgB/HAM1 family non-canonical purine NTP pyrophosphatase [Prevotella sp.]
MKLIAATNNEHKLSEIRSILGDNIEVLSLNDIDLHTDIEENGTTLKENSHLKASFVMDYLESNDYPFPYAVIADDTGLLVDALDGAPGVHTARYAGGDGHDSEANMKLLLKNLEGKENRKAHFSTVITMIEKSADGNVNTEYFIGRVDGTILTEKHGEEGFGYDPVFCPDGYDKSFAELGIEVKNGISHRARAVQQLADYLLNK